MADSSNALSHSGSAVETGAVGMLARSADTAAGHAAYGDYTVVILGATSAIARAIAHEYARDGYRIVLAARNDRHNDRLASDVEVRFGVETTAVHFDAEDFESHQQVFETMIEAAQGRLAGVVLCFGFMDTQARAQEDAATARRTIDVNLTAAISMLERFADVMAKEKRGFIAVLSSVAGDRGRQSNYIYGAAKAGLTTYLQGLRNRLHPSGVSVTTIKPGFVDTKMTFGLPGLFLVASPEHAAKAIVAAIRKRKNVTYVPFFWRYIMAIIRTIPEWQFKKMKL